jgi:hypothetical protein
MEPRELSFNTYREIIDDIQRLRSGNYEQLGQWTLGQICKHMSYYLRGSLDGYPFMMPWIVRKLFGRPLLRRVFARRQMPRGGRTIPQSVPQSDVDETTAINETIQLLERLESHTGEVHPSPLFGALTPDECRTLHCLHAAHHLQLLIPS